MSKETKEMLPLEEEAALVASARGGDSAAMMRLVTQYEPLLRRAAGQAHLQTIRDDALAEATISLVRAVHDYDAAAGVPFAAFLKSRVYGDLRALFRRAVRTWQHETSAEQARRTDADGADALPLWELVADPAAARALTRLEQHAALAAAMRTLTPRERDVLRLLYIEETTQKTAAARLGMSQPGVAGVRRRALAKLRTLLLPPPRTVS